MPNRDLRRPAEARPQPLTGLAGFLDVPLTGGPSDPEATLTGVTHDSRAVRPGDLYAGLQGEHVHGAAFATQAAEAGAAALLTDPAGAALAAGSGLPALVVADPRGRLGEIAAWVYGRPAEHLTMYGVTGTNGKTTTAYLLDGGLRAGGGVTGMIGTVETRIGEEVVPSVRTTPEATDVQALLASMLERGVTDAVMEVSSHALALGRVDGTVYDVALFTNLSQDHLDFHPSMEDYFLTKADLFTPRRSRLGVIDVDDAYGRRLAKLASVPVLTVSATGDQDADWRAENVELGPDGSRFTVVGPDCHKAEARVRLAGPFNVSNALLAIVALTAGGVSLDDAVEGVGRTPGVPGRMERVDVGQPFEAVVDFAHTPDAVETLLRALRPVTSGALTIVLGAGGDRDRAKRPLMASAAARFADAVVLTSDNPRSEDPNTILDEMLAGIRAADAAPGAVLVEPDRVAAIALAVDRAAPGDTVVIAGKGHEQGQEFANGVKHPFDDRVELRAALARTMHAGPASPKQSTDARIVAPAPSTHTPTSETPNPGVPATGTSRAEETNQ
ncbi:UDP-N-acetylmuramoyl-L-alanyl-D-glutamate--2,6-diaminopimelate ligase [Embleya scabrispora]|uniref:UDP-N-acetylmuramoyl-L-alanyl-D-glutamate--2,6-diaminopimelate ligase n=1 Tax=Embleya scabrispora TaxID=159449 RepID=A0A1T3P2G4_9ACTN|nr:UDP-N-acetylmuramoyl-L-alanyl-D-glutamate--2,6-diaminopimelate ligase [Embleya scabrispora]OPC83299.1 UDP-N-acetylmuramoyl-L-alanyl-D-glutamate--2,6-diaminopimelate ligase [Embleya scabrispora]